MDNKNDQSNDFTNDDQANDAVSDFDQPVDQEGFSDAPPPEKKASPNKLAEMWESNPLFKLMVIMVGVAVLVAVIIWLTSGSKDPSQSVGQAPDLNEAPGGQATPAFLEALKQDATQRAQKAERTGGSSMPTPGGTAEGLEDEEDPNKATNDMLLAFREELERMRVKQDQQSQMIQQQLVQQQQTIQEAPFDDGLMRLMMEQMAQLTESWQPKGMALVSGIAEPDEQIAPTAPPAEAQKLLVPAGTVNYAQMLTEANSDVPSPILAQILSGPFSGARAVGTFEYFEEYLVLRFKLISYKGKDYQVDAVALDPETTLGGVATEVDHRYFSRIILPAAAAFVTGFTSALAQSSDRTVVNGDVVFQERASKSFEEGIYEGVNEAGQSISQYLQQRAQQIRTLVRVAAGSPIGFFFVTSVYDQNIGPQNAQALGLTPNYANSSTMPSQATVQNLTNTGVYPGQNTGGVSGATQPGVAYPTSYYGQGGITPSDPSNIVVNQR